MARVLSDKLFQYGDALADIVQAVPLADQAPGGDVAMNRIRAFFLRQGRREILIDPRIGRTDRPRHDLIDRGGQVLSIKLELVGPYDHTRPRVADQEVDANFVA